MNASLPEELRTFVDEQVEDGRYGSTSEYVRDLIRRDQDRHRLRSLLFDGATSAPGPVLTTATSPRCAAASNPVPDKGWPSRVA